MRVNPFNPQLPARPDFFVGREPELIQFEKFLVQTVNDSPMNLSISGNRGMGKTSLLVKFEEIAKANQCLVLRLSNYEGNVYDIISFSDFIIANLKREILSKSDLTANIKKLGEWVATLKPQIAWKDVSLSIEKQNIVQELLRQRLKKLFDESKERFKATIILIDEAESLEKVEGVLSFLREVFQRLSTEANYMIVLAGKLNFPERTSESFSPLNRFFPVHKLNQFSSLEIKDYLQRKLSIPNISIENEAIEMIFNKSEGHPYVTVSMGYTIFDALREDEDKITAEVIQRATPKIDAQIEQDFFAPMYHPLTPKAKEILSIIVKHIQGIEFSFGKAVKWTEIEKSYLSPYIQEMLRKGILNKPERGQYQFFHGLFISYVKKLPD